MFPPRPFPPRRWLFSFLAGALCAKLACLSALAININGEGLDSTTGVYDRFMVGTYPGTPVPNPDFIGASLDLSGVGWVASNPNQSITLVSPQYFVGSSHFFPSVGTTLRFFGADHSLYSVTVHSYHVLSYTGSDGTRASDLTLGRLTTTVSSAVTPMPIFYPGDTDISIPSSFDQYADVLLLNYGRTARMGVNELDGFGEFGFGPTKTSLGLVYTQGPRAGQTLLEGGDSGSPTIAYRDGTYGLFGTHSGVVTSSFLSVDTFVGYTPFVNQMNAYMAADGQALTFAPAPVPEPATLFVGIALFGICGAQRLRRPRSAP